MGFLLREAALKQQATHKSEHGALMKFTNGNWWELRKSRDYYGRERYPHYALVHPQTPPVPL